MRHVRYASGLVIATIFPMLTLTGCGGGGDPAGGGDPVAVSSPTGGNGGGTNSGSGLTPGSVLTAVRGKGLESETYDPTSHIWSVDLDNSNASLSVPNPGINLTLPNGQTAPLSPNSAANADGSRTYTGSITGTQATVTLTSYSSATNSMLNYSDYGVWAVDSGGLPLSFAAYAVGSPTPLDQMPTSGTATYAGGAAGQANVGGNSYTFTGNSNLTANFGSGSISGGITGLQTSTGQGMNNISLSGNISGNSFSGSAAAVAGAAPVNIGGQSGYFGGGFQGPGAKEATGTFKMAGSGSDSVIGSFGASKQ